MRYIIAFLLLSLSFSVNAHDRDSFVVTKEFKVESANKKASFSLNDLSKYKIASLGDIKIMNHRGELKSTIKNVKGVLLKDIVDSSFMDVKKPKDYSEYYLVLTASDGYKNVYSWNELYNNDLGNHIYIITEKDGKKAAEMNDCILVVCLSDINTGRRHLKNLSRIEIKRAD